MLTALRPLERLVVAGGVCHLINRWLYERGGPSHLARGRAMLLGEISDFCLDGLIACNDGTSHYGRRGGASRLCVPGQSPGTRGSRLSLSLCSLRPGASA